MRGLQGAWVGVWAAVLLGCTGAGPQPRPEEQGELPEPAQAELAHAGFVVQPERARVIDPATQPRLELRLREAKGGEGGEAGETGEAGEEELCPFVVEARQFPAISEDGATLVHASIFAGGNAGAVAERMQLSWLERETSRVDEVYDRSADQPWDPQWSGCAGSIAAARERVAALNASLAERSWRPLEALDAYYSEPGFAEAFESMTGNEDEAILGLAGGDRPIEVYYHNGVFIARVRGLKVLQKTPRPGWRGPNDEICSPTPNIAKVEFDRISAAALVRYNYSTGGCLCDDSEQVGRVELGPELRAAIEERSTAAFTAARLELDERSDRG